MPGAVSSTLSDPASCVPPPHRRRRAGGCMARMYALLCNPPILMDVTRCPQAFSSTPMEEAVTPLPSPLTTPPATARGSVRWVGPPFAPKCEPPAGVAGGGCRRCGRPPQAHTCHQHVSHHAAPPLPPAARPTPDSSCGPVAAAQEAAAQRLNGGVCMWRCQGVGRQHLRRHQAQAGAFLAAVQTRRKLQNRVGRVGRTQHPGLPDVCNGPGGAQARCPSATHLHMALHVAWRASGQPGRQAARQCGPKHAAKQPGQEACHFCRRRPSLAGLLLPDPLGVVVARLHRHGAAVGHVVQAIVCSVVERLADLVLPRVVGDPDVRLRRRRRRRRGRRR